MLAVQVPRLFEGDVELTGRYSEVKVMAGTVRRQAGARKGVRVQRHLPLVLGPEFAIASTPSSQCPKLKFCDWAGR